MNKDAIEQLVKEKMAECFADLTKDVAELKANQMLTAASLKRIERGLFGDAQLGDTGLAQKIEFSYEYARKNTESGLVTASWEGVNFIVDWKKNGNWKSLEEIIKRYAVAKAILAIGIGSSILSILNIVAITLEIINKIKP